MGVDVKYTDSLYTQMYLYFCSCSGVKGCDFFKRYSVYQVSSIKTFIHFLCKSTCARVFSIFVYYQKATTTQQPHAKPSFY